uniref:Sugar phosphate transporter domain-containing protein n=1 Tax=Romanomermis culicivorax TaxID=13658 RepID=A0A915KKD6_ROMCU
MSAVNKLMIPNEESSNFGDDYKEGLLNFRAISLLVLWYFFSFCTLFLNKYILSTMQGEPTLLGAIQMMATTCLGFIQMYFPCGLYRKNDRSGKPRGFWRNMALVGCMSFPENFLRFVRFSTVVLGLFALKYISVSFTETVKSTAPLFTVVIAYFLLDEKCGVYVISSLIPVMGGLALCSAYELSFNTMGFLAAIATNLMDCLQNVFSKLLISNSEHRYTPAELQFYTSVASIFVQIPATYFVIDYTHALRDIKQSKMNAALLINSICFHLQSITAYSLMGYISPITHSVANTTKRAILIWLSVIIFGNDVTFWSAAGTALVLVGVLLYNKARNYEQQKFINVNLRIRPGFQIMYQEREHSTNEEKKND